MNRGKGKVVEMFSADSVNPVALRAAHWRTTDIANAEAFVDDHADSLRYAHRGAGWHVWADGRWRPDTTEQVLSLGQGAVTKWWSEVGTAGSQEERAVLAAHYLKSGKRPRIEAMLALAAADRRIALPPDAFDRNPWLLTVANGTLDLRTGQLRPHDPTDLISKRTAVPYLPGSPCPRFQQFLTLIFNGDQTLIDFVQRAAGYSATGAVSEQCLMFGWGTGANGKSTLFTIMMLALGEYARAAAPSLLMASKYEAHPTEIADLMGARLVTAIETEQDRRLAEVKVKWLTGSDRLKARFMRQDFFEFDPTHTFWLAGNHKPVVQGQDPAIWRRLHLVPFTVNLKERLQGDVVRDFAFTLADELPGILAWIVDGAMDWHIDGLRPPEAVRVATAAYQTEMDAVGQWFAEFCERGTGTAFRTPFKALYAAYAQDAGSEAMSKRSFAQELDRLGVHDHEIGGVHFREGARLRVSEANP